MNFESAKRKIMKILRKPISAYIYDDITFNNFANTFTEDDLCIKSNSFYIMNYTYGLKFVIEFRDWIHIFSIDNIKQRANTLLRNKICLLIVNENGCSYDISPACIKTSSQLLDILKKGGGYNTLRDMFREKLELPQAKDL